MADQAENGSWAWRTDPQEWSLRLQQHTFWCPFWDCYASHYVHQLSLKNGWFYIPIYELFFVVSMRHASLFSNLRHLQTRLTRHQIPMVMPRPFPRGGAGFTVPFLARYCWPRCQCPRDGSTICPWTVGIGGKAEAGPLEQNRPRTAGPKADAKHQQTSLCFLAQQMPKSTFEILPSGPLSRWSSVNRWFSISRWFFCQVEEGLMIKTWFALNWCWHMLWLLNYKTCVSRNYLTLHISQQVWGATFWGPMRSRRKWPQKEHDQHS